MKTHMECVVPKASMVGSDGSQPSFTLLTLTFRLCDFEQKSLFEPMFPFLAIEASLQGFCENWMSIMSIYLSAGADQT